MKTDELGRPVYTMKDLQKAAARRDNAKQSADIAFATAAGSALLCFGCMVGMGSLADVDHKTFFQFLGQATHLTTGVISSISAVALAKEGQYYSREYNLAASEVAALKNELENQKNGRIK